MSQQLKFNTIWLLPIIVSIMFSMAIVYVNVMTYHPILTPVSGYIDTTGYIAMARGERGSPLQELRPLVPWLVRLIPDIPEAIFDDRSLTEENQIVFKFGVINFLFLAASSLVLFLLQRQFGLTDGISVFGMLFFLSNPAIVRSAGLPMVDTVFFFFFLLTILGIQKNNYLMIAAASVIGVFAKELVLLAFVLVWLTPQRLILRVKSTFFLLPALAAYSLLWVLTVPADTAIVLDISAAAARYLSIAGRQLSTVFTVSGMTDFFRSFGFVWPLAIYAICWGSLPKILRCWVWFLPIVFIGVLFGSGNIGRSTFTAFPVVIPIAAFGLQNLVKNSWDDFCKMRGEEFENEK